MPYLMQELFSNKNKKIIAVHIKDSIENIYVADDKK